jgi:hypothetical protein
MSLESDDAPAPTRFEPPVSGAGGPFWEASRSREFVLPWCTACSRAIWYPREVCPHCHATDVDWRPASGRGEVYAVSVQHRPANPMMADRVPYAVALIDLDEGPRMLSNVVDVDPTTVSVGDPVEVTWEPLTDGRHLPVFRPRS